MRQLAVKFLDTSAILNGADLTGGTISAITLMELEHIKCDKGKDDSVKAAARQAVNNIINKNICVLTLDKKKVKKVMKQYPFLMDINDHYILCEAELFAREHNTEVEFYTSDRAQYIFACRVKYLQPHIYEAVKSEPVEYRGWDNYHPDELQMSSLYTDPTYNILHAKTNEYCKIYEEKELKDILRWNGEQYLPLRYKNMKNPYTNEVLQPRNLEQKMAFDLLQNDSIKVKLLTSAWGGGKTLLALTYALEQLSKGEYQKLVFVRNNIIVADTKDIGYLPGNLNEKMAIWGAPLSDHLGGQDTLLQLIEEGVIEIYPLSHIRGRSIKSSIVLCDECENMNDKLVTLLLSRIEESSIVIFCGDVVQIDDKHFEKNNGIRAMLQHLAGEPLFGTVKLIKSERGKVPQLCDKIRPPI